jgi:hypothetical protein
MLECKINGREMMSLIVYGLSHVRKSARRRLAIIIVVMRFA